MPHLAPLNWVIMPLAMMTIIYMNFISMHFNSPSCFPSMKFKSQSSSPWMW